MELLQKEGACLSYADPFTPSLVIDGKQYKAVDASAEELAQCDCALILTAHSTFNYDMIVQQASLVFDTRYGTRNIQALTKNVVLLS